MRTFLFAFCALLAIATPAAAANRNFGVTSFTKGRVEGPFKVSLATDVAPFARATGSSAALDRVEVTVSGDTFVGSSSASSGGGYTGSHPGPGEIGLGTHR